MAHYSLGWLPRWARAASKAPRLANAMLGGPLAGLGKRLAGIDRRRTPPRFATSAPAARRMSSATRRFSKAPSCAIS